MEVKISHIENVKFAIQARSHTIICDQPTENSGTDAGMTPPELMLASLGSCAAFYAAQFLKARNLPQHGLEVSVTAEKVLQPARLNNFHLNVVCATPLNSQQSEGMTRAVHHCLIHNTLLSPPQIKIAIAVGAPR
jgi:putative redox protein